MTYIPVVPFAGFAGWAFLERTRESQQEAFNSSAKLQLDADYFRENISSAMTAEDLVSDRRLMAVALGAFGLDADINNKFFMRKVLEDGTLDDDALGNRLADKRYLAFAKAFGFGDFSVANTQLSDFPDEIISAYQVRQFEIAVGEQNQDMRLALGFEREIDDLLAIDTTANGFWFSIMGSKSLRAVFDTAMGLPLAFGALDLDQQMATYREKAERIFGGTEVAQFADPEVREKLVRLFLVRSQAANEFSLSTPGAVALALLQNASGNAFRLIG